MIVVGPSASNFFQGGDSIKTLRAFESDGGGVESRTRRRFAGLSSSEPSLGRPWPLVYSSFLISPLAWPFVEGGGGGVRSIGESGGVDSTDKGESAPESASSKAAVEGFRLSVLRRGGGTGDRDGEECRVVLSPLAADASWWGGSVLALALPLVGVRVGEEEAAGAEACEADALGSVIATRGERGFKEGKGVAISAESASDGPKMMSAGWLRFKLSDFEVCA